MAKRKTHDEFVQQMQILNSNIRIIGKYISANKKVRCECIVDGNIWDATPNNLLFGHGCPVCSGNKKKNHSEFVMELNCRNPNIKVISQYKNNYSDITCECKVCGYIWDSTPHRLLQTIGCLKCSDKVKRTQEQFIKEVNQINPNIEIISDYKARFKDVRCKCLIDGHIWSPIANNLLLGEGCPVCKSSKGERKIYKWLSENGILFETQKTYQGLIGYNGGSLKYDFYLPKYNLLIEYQGNFHDNSIHNNFQTQDMYETQKEYDKRKKQYAIKHNIELLEIWYWDFDNIEQILNKRLNKLEVNGYV